MRRIVAIRPEPGLSATLEAGRAAGLEIAGWPLFEYRPRDWQAPDPGQVDGLLVGSASAIRLAGPRLDRFRDKPVHAVGEATACAADRAGLRVETVGDAGLQKLLGRLATRPLRLLRLAGAEHVPLIAPEGIELETRIVYGLDMLPLPPQLADLLREGAVVLLHSAAAARHFAAECDRRGVLRAPIALAALGPRISAAAGSGWAAVRAAQTPTEAALLALARDMCH
ncbi:MAG TPA: uroporphyrinogen-III synthase [Sphingomonadaceae bacterium]